MLLVVVYKNNYAFRKCITMSVTKNTISDRRIYTMSVYVKYIGPKISKKNPTVTGPIKRPLPQGTVSTDAIAPVTSKFEFAQARVVGISTALTAPIAMVDIQITE